MPSFSAAPSPASLHLPISDYIAFAHRLADASGAAIRPYFGQPLTVDAKADNSPVSIADREAEAAIRALIEKEYPDHGIFGEEFGTVRVGSHAEPPRSAGGMAAGPHQKHYVWAIDPIDGTRAFLAGSQEWGTLIALCEDGVPILGILDQPVTGERWVGVKDGAASFFIGDHTRPSEELMTQACPSLTAARISCTFCRSPDDARYNALAARCKTVLTAGDCYAYGLLARGKRDLVLDTALKPYDILALVPIIESAGGVITGWDGAPITLRHFDTVLAAGDPSLHREALAVLKA